jgi:hypothetical protein
MDAKIEGIYAAYMTARAGTTILLFVIKDSKLTGVDMGGMKYDGELSATKTGFHCSVVYVIPPGVPLITGSPPATSPQRIPLEFDLPTNFASGQTIKIDTPLGPLNARFEKLRDF